MIFGSNVQNTLEWSLHVSIFLPNVIKIEPYNFELYRFKVCMFFETQFNCAIWLQNKRHCMFIFAILFFLQKSRYENPVLWHC